MVGRIVYRKGKATDVRCDVLCGLPVLTLGVPPETGWYAALCARKAAKAFAARHIRLAAFPRDYPYQKVFRKHGIGSASETALLRACAPQIALFTLRESGIDPKNATVALCAEEFSADAVSAAETLAQRVRFLALSLPDGEALAQHLRHTFGISVRLFAAGERAACDAALCFDGAGTAAAGKVRVLSADVLSARYCPASGESIEPELLALLVQCGAISAGEIGILSLTGADERNGAINSAALLTKNAEKNMMNS